MGLPVCLVGPGSITKIVAAQGLELQAQCTEHARIEALDKTTEDLAPKTLHAWGYFGPSAVGAGLDAKTLQELAPILPEIAPGMQRFGRQILGGLVERLNSRMFSALRL